MNYGKIWLGIFPFLVACGGNPQAQTSVSSSQKTLTFPLPEVPVMLRQVEDRLNYVVEHYWDRFDFCDTAYIHAPEVTEQALVNYIDLLGRVALERADSSLTHVVRRAMQEPAMDKYLTETFRRYLMDPNSPLRNDELYEPVARLLAARTSDIAVSSRAGHDLRLIRINRRGTRATDFTYTLSDGTRQRLHRLSAERLILLFYDPDCENCANTLEAMKASSLLADRLARNKVKVLAVYADEDTELWKKAQSSLPDTWLNAYDKERRIIREGLYDLQALPSLYLLDADKTVLLKDAAWERVERYLSEHD